MLQQFQSHIQQRCKTTDKILLAVSGGLDSMVMLDLFRQSGFQIQVAHCNFQLRGTESDQDEIFLRARCQKWNIPFHSNRFDTNNYATEHGLSIQMAARELRYNWFGQLQKGNGIHWIATAHHLNDSIETLLLNLTKGTSLDGLLGIPERNNDVIRPLLFATRQDIQNYAAENTIAFREDESNQTDDYQRNFIRHQVIPKLKELNPSFENSVGKTIQKLQGSARIISQALENWKKLFLKTENGKLFLAKAGFQNSSGKGHTTSLLWELLKDYGFHFDQCQNIFHALDGQTGKRFLSSTYQLIIDRENLIVFLQPVDLMEVKIEADQTEVSRGNQKLKFESAVNDGLVNSDKSEAILDESLIHFPIIWRKWKTGDYFFPLGMEHRKKISDFLIDEKVSLVDKDSLTVLEAHGELIWIVGHRIDERFKVTEGTKQVIKFRWSS